MNKKNNIVNVNLSFRNLESTPALTDYCQEKIGHVVKKYVHRDTDVKVVLLVEKSRQIAEAQLLASGSDIKASEESGDMYISIDKLADSLGEQLRRNKDKLTSHH
jgi:putative sigma-54 modulation protein